MNFSKRTKEYNFLKKIQKSSGFFAVLIISSLLSPQIAFGAFEPAPISNTSWTPAASTFNGGSSYVNFDFSAYDGSGNKAGSNNSNQSAYQAIQFESAPISNTSWTPVSSTFNGGTAWNSFNFSSTVSTAPIPIQYESSPISNNSWTPVASTYNGGASYSNFDFDSNTSVAPIQYESSPISNNSWTPVDTTFNGGTSLVGLLNNGGVSLGGNSTSNGGVSLGGSLNNGGVSLGGTPNGGLSLGGGRSILGPLLIAGLIAGAGALIAVGGDDPEVVPTPPTCVPVSITSDVARTITAGSSFSYSITASGTGPISFTVSGLPDGLTSSGSSISGIVNTPGTYSITLTASNSCGTMMHPLVLTVIPSSCPTEIPAITSSLARSGTVGTAFSYTISATSNPSNFGATGLPTGLTIDTSTGIISGTPTVAGTFNATITASNGCGSDSETLVITINPITPCTTQPSITSTLARTGTVGSAFTYTITATNNPSSFSATSLPTGLVFDSATGVISGTPTVAGTFNVTITATNNCGTDTETLVITVVGICVSAPSITSTLTQTGTVGSNFSHTIVATNNPTSFGATGLPAGLNFDTSTGIISGTPTVAGTFNVTITATNACGTDTETLVITIVPLGVCVGGVPSITSSLSQSVLAASPFSYNIIATNNPTSYGAAGLVGSLAVNATTGGINGVVGTPGTYNIPITATNACGSDTETLVLTVTSGGGGGGGGGGGTTPPVVTLTRISSSTPAASSLLYLSQIPYTGLGGLATMLAFFTLILLASIAAAYLATYRFGKSYFAAEPISIAAETILFETIIPDVSEPVSVSQPETNGHLPSLLETRARENGVVISEEATEFIITVAQYHKGSALSLLDSILIKASAHTTSERLFGLSKQRAQEFLLHA